MISDLIQTLLHKRGITEADVIEKFLKPNFARGTYDPFLLEGMERAVACVFFATSWGAFVVQQENAIIFV